MAPVQSDAFDLAAKENKPVMLVVSAVWCYWCHVYESPDYLYNENVYPYINDNFIPASSNPLVRPPAPQNKSTAIIPFIIPKWFNEP